MLALFLSHFKDAESKQRLNNLTRSSKWWSQDANPSSVVPESALLTRAKLLLIIKYIDNYFLTKTILMDI